jgi:hypothetical protein
VLVPNRESWTFRRFGIYEGYVIQVEPTLGGGWLWNPVSYYHEQLLQEVGRVVRSSPMGRVLLDDLVQRVTIPPCIHTSLKVFLRQYPDRIYIHTDLTEGHWWVHLATKPFQLPTFGHMNIEIGRIKHFQPVQFDWGAYQDVDDMLQLASFEAVDEEQQQSVEAVESSVEEEGVSKGQRQLDALDQLIEKQSKKLTDSPVEEEAPKSAEELAEELRQQEAMELEAALNDSSSTDYDSSITAMPLMMME